MFNCMLIDLKGMLTRGFKMGNAEIEPPKSILPPLPPLPRRSRRSPAIFMAAPLLTVSTKCWRRLSPKLQQSTAKPPMRQIPDAEGYARSRTEKECYDAFQSLNTKLTRCTPLTARRLFVTFWFGLGTSWERRV